MLWAVKAIRECGFNLRGRIGLLFVPDEETGGRLGTQRLAEQGLLDPGAIGMLTPEPTSGLVWNACRGAISLRVRVGGKTAHVGQHFRGENAFVRMHHVVAELLKLQREVGKRRTRFRILPSRARESILLIGGASGGGSSFNAVPEECWFTVDRRVNPEEELAGETRRLMAVFDRLRLQGIPIDVEVLQEGWSACSDEHGPLGNILARSIAAVTGKRPAFEMCPGLLETRFYAARGIPAYAYGPGLLSVSHGPNEYVDLRRVADCAAVYALSALHLLDGPAT
jgi:acetylornithine deacetylase/succinyl-diaminopimelate desuccinylase-like protein